MSEQALDLRRFVRAVRRHRMLVGIAIALGLLVGGALAVLTPPTLTSKALVVFPRSAPSIATQVVIATSNPVLAQALPDVSPAMSINTLRTMVQAKSLTAYLISVSAQGTTAAQAEGNANAVAKSYVAYVTSDKGVVSVPANIFEPASTATGTSPVKRIVFDAVAGAVCGALIGIIAALVLSRTDRRLRTRDEIANAMGLPVLSSLPVGHPVDVAGWTKLLEAYKPGAVDSWWLRNALKELGVVGGNIAEGDEGTGPSLTIVSLTSDPGALALGPQLAAFAASLGIVTALVIGPLQDAEATAELRTACAAATPASSMRSSQLHVSVFDGDDSHVFKQAALTVVVVMVDDQAPKFPAAMRTTATVLGVSAGVTTAEQLARAAVTAVTDGREIAGVMVADPESSDQTAGRNPRPARGARKQTARMPERRGAGHRSTEPRSPEPRSPGPRSAGPRGPEYRGPEPRGLEPRGLEPRGAEQRTPELRSPESRGPEPRSPEPRSSEPRSPEPRSPEPRSSRDQPVNDPDQTIIFSSIGDDPSDLATEIRR